MGILLLEKTENRKDEAKWSFTVKDGKIVKMTKEEFESQNAVSAQELSKDMTPEELERFKKERYEKFLKPLMGLNERQIKSLKEEKEE